MRHFSEQELGSRRHLCSNSWRHQVFVLHSILLYYISYIAENRAVTSNDTHRLGTPAMTTRGMTEQDMIMIAGLIHDATILASKIQDSSPAGSKKMADFIPVMESALFENDFAAIKGKVEALALSFPLPGLKP